MPGSKHRKQHTHKSSRIPPQAREYISEVAVDRELERFMALSSTASSGASGSLHSCAMGGGGGGGGLPAGLTSHSSGNGSGSVAGARRHRPRSRELFQPASTGEVILKTTPIPISVPISPPKQAPEEIITIIPILMEAPASVPAPAAMQKHSYSVEDLRTPTKPSKEMHTKKTQTPESALKTHKRLEWDPAADVGYYKRALSTSNISTLERSVLEECGWRQPVVQQQQEEGEEVAREDPQEKPTPPLASSTFVNRSARVKSVSNSGLESQCSSQREASLASSRKEESQSSSHQPDSRSSSRQPDSRSSSRLPNSRSSSRQPNSRSSSLIPESTSSSHLPNSRSSSRIPESRSSSKREETSANSRLEDPPVNSQRESQASSRLSSQASSRREDFRDNSRRASQATCTSLYGSSVASSFDYNNCLDEWQKDKDVGRTSEEPKGGGKKPGAKEQPKQHSSEREQPEKDLREREQPEKDQRARENRQKDHRPRDDREKEQRKAEQREKEREKERQYTSAQLEKVLGNRRRDNKENRQPQPEPPQSVIPTSSTATSSRAGSGPPFTAHKGDLDLGIELLCSLVKTRSLTQGQKKQLVKDIARRISCLEFGESSTSSRSLRSSQSGNQVEQGKVLRQDASTWTSQAGSQRSSPGGTPTAVTLPVPAPRKRTVGTSTPSPLPASLTSCSSTSAASHELVTQKANLPASRDAAASTDADVEVDGELEADQELELEDPALPEWLNPMTQSEIEYDERRKAEREAERHSKIEWIEQEIKRLLGLQELLAKAVARCNLDDRVLTTQAVQTEGHPEEGTPPPPKPPVRHESVGARPRQLPPLPLSASSTARSDSSAPLLPSPPPPPPPPPSHQHGAEQAVRPTRRKMATPVLVSHSSSSGGGRSESVCSFVQQRQRQFREHYENQQQHQQQLLLLQQRQLHQQQQHLYEQQQLQHQQHRLIHGQCSLLHQQPPPHPHPQCQRHGEFMYARATGGYTSADQEGAIYYQVVSAQGATGYVQASMIPGGAAAGGAGSRGSKREARATSEAGRGGGRGVGGVGGVMRSNSTTTRTTSLSSSMLCLSSEMSIPMEMVNTCETTTTTTTHQYDDVACQRNQQRGEQDQASSRERMQRHTLQMRPQGIAYLIRFTTSESDEDQPALVPALSLQDQLQRARPEFCAKSKERKAILNQMQMLRNERRQEMEELLKEPTSAETLDRRLKELPPPPMSTLRVFTTKEMKAITSKRCQVLPEVLEAQKREVEQRRRHCNRLMRDVFNKRLQNRVAKGQLSLNHSKTII